MYVRMEEFGVNGQLQKYVQISVDHVQNYSTQENVFRIIFRIVHACKKHSVDFSFLKDFISSGESSRYILCNTQPCAYPAQRACCIPYVPMLINKTMTCGPLPKDTGVSSESPCCPKGGLWSEWTGFAQYGSDKTWKRTRKCLSEEMGCPCTNPSQNVETSTKCPCRDMQDVKEVTTRNNGVYDRNLVIDDPSCLAYQTMRVEDTATIYSCNGWKFYSKATVMRFVTPQVPTDYTEVRVSDCSSTGPQRVTFYCDLKTLYWRIDFDNSEILGFHQLYLKH
uniref:VWFD domain-containing protein n=1 Tax=Caenorhabditis tropicalis TaxID=1561998 RepID=A0A1I7UM69_9PELO